MSKSLLRNNMKTKLASLEKDSYLTYSQEMETYY